MNLISLTNYQTISVYIVYWIFILSFYTILLVRTIQENEFPKEVGCKDGFITGLRVHRRNNDPAVKRVSNIQVRCSDENDMDDDYNPWQSLSQKPGFVL